MGEALALPYTFAKRLSPITVELAGRSFELELRSAKTPSGLHLVCLGSAESLGSERFAWPTRALRAHADRFHAPVTGNRPDLLTPV